MGGAIGPVAQIGSSILGGISEQKSLERQQEFNEQINQVNQQASRNKIKEIRQQSIAKRRAISKRGKAIQGKAIGAVAKSGVTMSGSPMDVILDNATNIEQDRMQTFRDGQILEGNTMSQMAFDNYYTDIKSQEIETQKTTAFINSLTGVASGVGGLAQRNERSRR